MQNNAGLADGIVSPPTRCSMSTTGMLMLTLTDDKRPIIQSDFSDDNDITAGRERLWKQSPASAIAIAKPTQAQHSAQMRISGNR